MEGNKLHLEKNGGHTPCSLGSILIVVVREADEILAENKNYKIQQIQF